MHALINTDRHAYHKELRSTERTYMASVSCIYPQDGLVVPRRQNALADATVPIDANLVLWQLADRPFIVDVFEHGDSYRAYDASGIGANNVLDGPSCQEDRFAKPFTDLPTASPTRGPRLGEIFKL
jgi:hypothetical protein